MKREIEKYEAREPHVVAVDDPTVRAWVGDAEATIGGTLLVGDQRGRIERLSGERMVEAIFFDLGQISVGDAVRTSRDPAHFPGPIGGRTAVRALRFVPDSSGERAPSVDRGAIATGLEPIDEWTPLVRGGINLVLDGSSDPGVFRRLVTRAVGDQPAVGALSADDDWELSHVVTYTNRTEANLARRVASHWAAGLNHPLVVTVGQGFDLDAFADLIDVTLFVRVRLSDGLDVLAESLDVGEADCQIVLTADGRIDFARSYSRLSEAEHGSLFLRAAELNERAALFGRDELDLDELEFLDRLAAAQNVLQEGSAS